ncbi:MAG: sugar phosphate isomerase/epimerase [Planctomycetaceae bacterium]|nr:sugar phosphate isomerase/epimerase [Planctomycetaceae bacterium]
MPRHVTIFTGQWADIPFAELCPKIRSFGYDGLEIASWGDHLSLDEAASSVAYCKEKRKTLADNGLGCWAISNHLAGQLTTDPNFDARSDAFCLDPSCRGDAEKKRQWAIDQMLKAPDAARNMGVGVVTAFMGSPIWHMLYSFPPVGKEEIDAGYRFVREVYTPIFEKFRKNGIRFALEVHPTEIAFDIWSAERLLEEFDYDEVLGFNFDPSHLLWQGVDPVKFLRRFKDRIYHVHMKDARVLLDGESGILGSHLDFGDPRRGWDFRSLGHGQVDFDGVIRALNDANYQGPLSVEWEDPGMDREFGAKESCEFVRKVDFPPSTLAFDGAFAAD